MRKWSWRYWPLAVKLTMLMTAIVVIAVIGITVVFVQQEQKLYRQELQQRAELLLNTLSALFSDSLVFMQMDDIVDNVRLLDDDYIGLTSVMVYDLDGHVVADAYNQVRVIPPEFDLIGRNLVQSDGIVYFWLSDQLIAGQVIFLDGNRVGAVSVGLSTAPLHERVRTLRNHAITTALFVIILGTGLVILFSRTISTPINQLARMAEEIEQGKWDQEISLANQDEIGLLAASFNRMTQQLRDVIDNLGLQASELSDANRRLQELDQLKSKFISDVSHELRTPVTNLLLYLDLFDGASPEKQTEYLAVIKNETGLLAQLIEDILQITDLTTRKQVQVLEGLDLDLVLEQIVLQYRPQAESVGLNLIYSQDGELPQIKADQMQIQQALANLVTNAIAYTPSGGEIRLHCTRRDSEVAGVAIYVEDTGVGIEPAEHSHIFDHFYRGSQTSQSDRPGTGLGLAIVKEIVSRHSGTVELQSELGIGSTFVIWLPVNPDDIVAMKPKLEARWVFPVEGS